MENDKRIINLEKGEIIPISFNYHFVRIFGENSNMDIIEYFISDYYNIPIGKVVGNIELLSRDLPQDSKGEKSKQVDLLLKLGNKKINIEISNHKSPGRKERDLVYLAKVHGEQLRYKQNYKDIGYSWQIRLNDKGDKDGKLIKRYYLTSDDEDRNIFSEKFRIDDINLAAAQNIEYNNGNEKLLRWCRIISANSRDKIVEELGDKLMSKETREKLLKEVDKNSRDEEIYDIYEEYSTIEMEREDEFQEALEAAVEAAVNEKTKEVTEEVTKEVTEEVTKEVTLKNARETAKKMLKEKLDISMICKISGLSKEEIEKLQNEI